ncbi:MAG: FkbM family methyltransferase [Polyangiaceae bacterium]
MGWRETLGLRTPDEPDRIGRQLRALAEEALDGRPLSVVDVGALWGLLPELRPIESFVSAVGFDPDAEECERLTAAAREQGLRQRFLPYLVAGTDERRTFHITRKQAASSLLEPDRAFFDQFPDAERVDIVDRREVETRALGPLLAAEGVEVEFLKLDAQGVEVEILDSLDEAQLRSILAVHVEVLFAELYVGQCHFADVDARLRAAGFELYELKRYSWRRRTFDAGRYRTRGKIAFADALYLRDSAGLSPEQRRRLALIAAIFRHFDLAHELVADDPTLVDAIIGLAPQGGSGPWASDADDWI